MVFLKKDSSHIRSVPRLPASEEWKRMFDLPAYTELSDTISKDLKRRGMNFVGSTIIYAIMQTIGMVNDHEMGCFRYNKL